MSPKSAEPATGAPWYRYPMMWLVVGGPAVVVVAAIVTAVIAYRGADPVVTAVPGAVPAKSAR
jgi:hypothetical protein